MGWFSMIATGAKALFGADTRPGQNVVSDTIRGVGTWIDERELTEEERMKANAQMVERYGAYLAQTVDENTERSKSRRAIALWVIRVELSILVASGALYPLNPEWSAYLFKVSADSPLGLLTLGIGAFFFGTHMLRAGKGK